MDGEEGTRTVPCMMAEEEGDHDRKVEEEEGEEAKNIATNDNRSSAASNKDEDEDEDEEEEEEENEEEEDDEDDSDSDSDSSDSTSNDNDSDDNNNDEENNDNDNNNNNDEDKNNNNDGLSAYERLRLERIKRNRERLIQLGLESKDGGGVLGPPKKTVSRKRRNSSNEPQQPMQPTRKSRRSIEPPKSYAEPGLRELLISQKTKTNANAGTAATPKQPSNKSNEPKEPKPRKLTKRDLRPTREIYDEFQAIRKHKRITLQQAKRNLRYAEREVQHWYRKATLQEKKQHKHKQAKSYKSSSSSNNTNTKQQWWTERDRQVFGTASALDFVHEMDARRNELETKMAEYDLVTLTPEQRLDREVARVQQQNKLKVLAALQVVPSSLETMAHTLSTLLVQRTPKDKPPPRRSRRSTTDPTPPVIAVEEQVEEGHDNKNKSNKRGRPRKRNSRPPNAKQDDSSEEAMTVATIAQLEATIPILDDNDTDNNDTDTNTVENDSTTHQQPLCTTTTTTTAITAFTTTTAAAARIDRSWLDQDGTQIPCKSFKTYIPQPDDTILYYPAGHYLYLQKYPDPYHIPLWQLAAQEQQQRAQSHSEAEQSQTHTRWWTQEWIERAASGTERLPILCRVVQAQAEFPPDFKEEQQQQQPSKGRQRPILRLAVTLQPLTPITPPATLTLTDTSSTSEVAPTLLHVPPVFTCVTFPDATLQPFVIPFAFAYIRNQTLMVGKECLHSPVKASVTGKPLYQKGKLISLAPAIDDGEEEYGDGRLVDKLEYVSKVVATLQRKKKHNNSYRDGSEGLVMSALDEFVIGEYLEGVLNKHGAALNNATTVDTNVDDADLLTLVRATFPTWLSASVQRGLEDRTKLELQPWDVKTKDGPPGKDFSSALNAFMEMGLHNSIDNMLRVKIECSIDDYIQATPTTLPFQEPILESAAPNYICAVPITMSFRRILSRLKQKGSKRPDPNAPCYYRSVGAILMDIQAIEDNCRTYNSSDSVLTNSAKDIVADVKRSVTGVVISHVHELRDKLKKETDEKQILADLVGDVSPDNNADDSEPVHPFQEPWKGLLFRDWIQSWQPKQRGSISTPWVPQAGDEVYYSRELHDKFLKGHMDSLSDHQCLPLDETIWDKHPAAPKSPAEANKWVVATIISLRAEFPRVRKPSEEGAFVTEAPILALRLQFSEGDTSVIHWRPCLFLSDMSDEVDRDTECCKACSLRISKSFLRPSWEIDLDKQQGDSGTPQGLSRDELDLIERNLNFLKRRCLQQILPDKFDANLSIEQVKNGYFPSAFTVSRSTLPQFDELLKPGETEEIEAPSRLSKKKGDGPPEIDTAAVDSLAAVGFVPPWMPQFIEAASSKKVPTTPLHESISPWPNLCLELVLLRIRSGYYRHTKAVQNDIAESFLNTQLLSWAPAAKKKINPIAMKKLAKAVLSTPYTVTTNDLPFTSITQTVTAKSEVVKEAMAQVKVRVVLEDPKENQPSKGRKKVAKQKKTGPTQVSGSKRKRELAVSNPDGNEMVLIAEVPMRSVQSLGRPEATWVQCDKCKKWRRLFALVPGQKLPSRWYCSMNKNDPARAECSAPEEDYDDAANECIVADAHATSEDALSDEETLFASHAQLLRRLYSAALVGTSEPQHFSVVYGLTPLRINRQRILSTILPTTVTQADHQAAFARKQLGTLLEAIARDPCKSKLPHSVTLKIFVDGEQISAPMPDPAEADPSAPTKAPSKTGDNSIKFGKRNLKVNNKLTRTLLKPSRGFPCVRCQAARKGLYTCRVLKSHSNVEFDLYKNFRGGGGLDGLVCTMLKLPPPPLKKQDADKATSSGNPAGLEQSKNAAGEDGDDDQGKLPDIGGGDGSVDKDAFTPTCDSTLPPTVASDGPANEAATTAKGNSTGQPAEIPKDALVANGDNTGHPTYASKNNQETAAADDGQEKEKADAGEMYRKAAAALEEAMELNALAEAYSEAPDRLSNYFIATTFPFDNRDNSYAFCIICGLPGDLLVCDKHDCPNVMHYECGGLSEVPEADWFCGECVPIPTAGNDAKIETPSAAEEEKATTDDLQASQVSKNVANNSSPNESKVDKADAMDTDPGGTDVQGAPTKENEEKPPAVTSCLPPIVTFDEKRATDLESSLDDLYFARTGRRRGEGKQKKSGVGALFQKRFAHEGNFTGEVVKVPTADHPYYKVKYLEDGDEEDLTEEELHEFLARTDLKKAAEKKRKLEEKRAMNDEDSDDDDDIEAESGRKRRGRPRKRAELASEDESGNTKRGRSPPSKSSKKSEDEESDKNKRSRTAKSPKKSKFADFEGDPLFGLSEVMQQFLKSQKVETAKDFMAAKTNDLAEQLVKWRKRKKLPALRGTGAAATISGAKGLIRQIVMEKGLDPYPEMKRGGMVHPGRSDTQGDNTVEDGNSRSSKENRLETPGREGKRQRRRPEFFGTRQR